VPWKYPTWYLPKGQPSPTLESLGPSHLRRHKSRVSLRGPPCVHDVSGTLNEHVRNNHVYLRKKLAWPIRFSYIYLLEAKTKLKSKTLSCTHVIPYGYIELPSLPPFSTHQDSKRATPKAYISWAITTPSNNTPKRWWRVLGLGL
jgi:hypothetical protein